MVCACMEGLWDEGPLDTDVQTPQLLLHNTKNHGFIFMLLLLLCVGVLLFFFFLVLLTVFGSFTSFNSTSFSSNLSLCGNFYGPWLLCVCLVQPFSNPYVRVCSLVLMKRWLFSFFPSFNYYRWHSFKIFKLKYNIKVCYTSDYEFGIIIVMLIASAMVVNTMLAEFCRDMENTSFSHMKAAWSKSWFA